MTTFNIVLISTYELGRQPFGIASPAAWLRHAGFDVSTLDLALTSLDHDIIQPANLVAFYLPMHTATRIAAPLIPRIRQLAPDAHLAAYGLYAPVNADYLRELGIQSLIGGEFEQPLLDLTRHLAQGRLPAEPDDYVYLHRQTFRLPDRTTLPDLARYASMQRPDGQIVKAGYTQATRGCQHLCRHCPVVPVYGGQMRVIGRDVVLADIRQQVGMGAGHISFGDPDFFNGPGHALKIVNALHTEFPDLTYDVTIKVEHLLQYQHHLPALRDTGCAFIITAVESLNDSILTRFDKGHTRAQFIEASQLCDHLGLTLHPTFVTFTPWTTLDDLLDLLHAIHQLDLIQHIAPVQYAIRLLIPAGSRLLELDEIQHLIGEFDHVALSYPWQHPDSLMDDLQTSILQTIEQMEAAGATRPDIYSAIWELVHAAAGQSESIILPPQKPIPHMTESWFC